MATRVLGPSGSRRRRRFLIGPLSLIVLLAALLVPSAQGVHDLNLFELDKNSVDSPAGGADDWNNVFANANTGCTSLGAVDCAFVADPQGPDTSIFTTGGSKDDLDVPNWRWTSGSVPDADEILDAYAAMYNDPGSGDQILYFGADRFAVNGSKDFGFWFFRNPVTKNANGTFSGQHSGTLATPGDILILGTFTQGGATTTVRVFRWVGTGGNATSNGTVQGPDAAFGDCVPGSANDDGCATVNVATIQVPWAHQTKDGKIAAGNIPSGGFVEGGINLSDLGLEGCFSSFVAETRSSPSVDATLKDFALGDFQACGVDVTTTPSSASIVLGQSITDTAVVTGSGISNPPTPTGTVKFFICSPAQLTNGVCSSGGTQVGTPLAGETLAQLSPGSATATSESFTPNAVGTWCWRAEYVPAAGSPYSASSDFAANECFTVTDTSSTATAQNWLPNDSATITSTGGSPLSGTVRFTLHAGGTCTGTVLYGPEEDTLTNATSPAQTSSNNTAVTVTTSQTVSWKVEFIPATGSGVSGSSHCESTALTITN